MLSLGQLNGRPGGWLILSAHSDALQDEGRVKAQRTRSDGVRRSHGRLPGVGEGNALSVGRAVTVCAGEGDPGGGSICVG